MATAGEAPARRGSAGRGGRGGGTWAAAARIALIVTVTVALLAGCTGRGAGAADPAGAGSGGTAGRPDEAPAVAAIRATIDAINATAGGPVAAQRAELLRVVIPDQADEQRRCPVATTTLAFDPAYRDLRPAPGDATRAAGPDGADAAYLLPAYIDIYSGDRITGSDLTTLRMWIVDGRARTAALCVS